MYISIVYSITILTLVKSILILLVIRIRLKYLTRLVLK